MLRAQSTPHMQINVDATSAKPVTLEEFDHEAAKSRLGRMGENLPPAAVMLVNNTDRAIVAYRAIWVSPNPDNPARPRRNIHTADIFMAPNQKPIVKAHSRTIIAPGTVIGEADGKGTIMAHPLDAVRHPGGSDTSVTLDAVLFEDGELVGPDSEDLAGDLNARKQAATMVADKLRRTRYNPQAFADEAPFTPTNKEQVKPFNALRDAENSMRQMTKLGFDLQRLRCR
jgi:hypothetical protein